MAETDKEFEEDVITDMVLPPDKEVDEVTRDIERRAKSAGISVESVLQPSGEPEIKVGMKCGRLVRWVYLTSKESILGFGSTPFEQYVYLSEFDGICSYRDGYIEAAVRPMSAGFMPSSYIYNRLFAGGAPGQQGVDRPWKLVLDPPQRGVPQIELSARSEVFAKLVRAPVRNRMSLKLRGCEVTTHDQALSLLKKTSSALFFQIDLLGDVPLALDRERRFRSAARRAQKQVDLASDLQYPQTEFDDAPLSLYFYARSATGMPLLQFLAFYQVLEFYFPIYSQAEAQRKLKTLLKDPTFRGDRDADVARLLSVIRVNRTGAYGDERSQLRATLLECVDADALRDFLEATPDRKEFYGSKAKTSPYRRIPISNPTADLRGDVAERLYDIRCKIVHTKNESREGEVDLLLPFSQEAEQLSFDIELVQYLAQIVIIAAGIHSER